MVESANRHVVKRVNLPEVNESLQLHKEVFDREEKLTAIKVPVTKI